jgi:hypothetical protein
VNATKVWTHNFRVACVIYLKDTKTDCPIQSQSRLDLIKEQLSRVMKGDCDEQSARCKIEYATESTQIERRLRQLMHNDQGHKGMDCLEILKIGQTSRSRRMTVGIPWSVFNAKIVRSSCSTPSVFTQTCSM